ncbi:MAG: multicopper oxidase family protein [Thermoplasmatota archaeon]
MKALLPIVLLLVTGLAGCLGGDEGEFTYRPGEDFTPTGRTIDLRATVLDLVAKEIYPGFSANMWAFCFKPADPDDEVSAAAIEYPPLGGVDTDQEAWKGTCSTPGPTLRVQQGDRVIVRFENNHVHPHTIHWHGQYVPWDSDGVPGSTQDSVKPGQSFKYDFIASRAGTLWYHCHVDTQFHVMQGLYGVMIVEPQDERWEPETDRDMVWTLGTLQRDLVEATPRRVADPHADHQGLGSCGVTGEQQCQNPPVDVTPDVFMINGVSFPNTLDREDTFILLEPDEKVRLRILNAGTTIETIHTHGHDMLVTHVDGNPLPPAARYYVDTIPVMPAQRIDVVIEGREGNEGVWVVHTHVVDHVVNDGQYPGGMLTKIVYPEFLDDKTPFAGVELPGGLPYEPPLELPEDLELRSAWEFGTAMNTTVTMDIPIELPCAVRAFTLSVESDSATGPTQLLNEIHLKLIAPDGDELFEEDLAAGRLFTWSFDGEGHLEAGNYTLEIQGRTVDSVIRAVAAVDYADTEEELARFGLDCDEDH